MDDRTLSWMYLLPEQLRIADTGAPEPVRTLLGNHLDEQGTVWLGWETAELPAELDRYEAVVLMRPNGKHEAALRTAGFNHIRTFSVVPGLHDARWFIPAESRRVAFWAWDLYTPFQTKAVLQKKAIQILAASGAVARAGDTLVVAQRNIPPLEQTLMQTLQAPQLTIAISSGTPGPRRKMTMQLAEKRRGILAYAKCASNPETGALVAKEATFIEHIQQRPFQQFDVPQVLYHGPHNGGYMLVMTPVSRQAAASDTTFGSMHSNALREMAARTSETTTLQELERLKLRIQRLEQIDTKWKQRLDDVCHLLSTTPGMPTMATTLSHGDFAPWNIRVDRASKRLIVFDWEQGACDRFPLWDVFHFLTQVHALVLRSDHVSATQRVLADAARLPFVTEQRITTDQLRALYAGYLADISVQWFEDRQMLGHQPQPEETDHAARGPMIDILVQKR